MFKTLLKIDYPKQLKEDAEPYIISERSAYKKTFDLILNKTKDANAIISDIPTLLDKHKYWTTIQIYGVAMDIFAKELLQELCKEIDANFTLKITEWDNTFYIEHNFRRICFMTSFNIYKTHSIVDFINPLVYTIDNIEILIMPPLLELIELYTILYTPAQATEWSNTLNSILQLEERIDKYIKTLTTDNKLNQIAISQSFSHNIEKNTKDAPYTKIRNLILDFVSDSNYLLLSHNASIINNTIQTIDIDKFSIFDLISKNYIDTDFKAISNYLSKFTSNRLVYKEKRIYIKDSMIKKYSFYLLNDNDINNGKQHILNIYNNTQYEIINYITITLNNKKIKFVDPITEIKFIYMDIWNIIISKRLSSIGFKIYAKIIAENFKQLKEYRKKINIFEQKKNYMGIYIDKNIQRKLTTLINPNINKTSYYCHELF